MKLADIKINIERRVQEVSIKSLLSEIQGQKANLVLENEELWSGVEIAGIYTNKHKAARAAEKLPRQVVDPDKKRQLSEVKVSPEYLAIEESIDLIPVEDRFDGKKTFVLIHNKKPGLSVKSVIVNPDGKFSLFR